jgi:hypothetical protein
MELSQIKFEEEIELPIANRLIAYYRTFKVFVIIVAIPTLVCINNPTEFNLIFSSFFFIIPIIPIGLYLRKRNIQNCHLKTGFIEIIVNNRKIQIEFSRIGTIKQMISTELATVPRLQSIYEIQLLDKYDFGNKLLLRLESKINPTEEHDIITELKNRIKTSGNTLYI